MIVDQITRFGGLAGQTCIDLFITRRSNKSVLHILLVVPPYASDHCTIVSQIGRPPRRKCILKTQYIYDQGDYPSISNAIASFNWDFIDDHSLSVDDVTQRFLDKLNALLSTQIPIRHLRPKNAPWMTSDIRTAQRRRDRQHRNAKLSDSPDSWTWYRTHMNLVNSV